MPESGERPVGDYKIITIIRNPVAGQKKAPFVERVIEDLRQQAVDVICLDTEYAGHAAELAAKLAAEDDRGLVVAAGGDGTIREVASGLYGTGRAMGLIPAGTANVLARELGYLEGGTPNAHRVASILTDARSCPVFPFEIRQGRLKQLGLCWLGAGFDAEVLIHVDPKWKARVGRAAFLPAIWKALIQEKRRDNIGWKIDDGEDLAEGACSWAVVSNIQRYAGPFVLTRETSINAEGLAVLGFRGKGILARIAEQMLIAVRPLDRRGNTRLLRSSQLILGGEDTPLQLDGDFIGYGPVQIVPLAEPIMFQSRQ